MSARVYSFKELEVRAADSTSKGKIWGLVSISATIACVAWMPMAVATVIQDGEGVAPDIFFYMLLGAVPANCLMRYSEKRRTRAHSHAQSTMEEACQIPFGDRR